MSVAVLPIGDINIRVLSSMTPVEPLFAVGSPMCVVGSSHRNMPEMERVQNKVPFAFSVAFALPTSVSPKGCTSNLQREDLLCFVSRSTIQH